MATHGFWVFTLAGLLLQQSNGCEQEKLVSVAPQKAIPYQRFIPVPRQPENVQGVPWSGMFALDTKTGMLCRTYEVNTLSNGFSDLPMCEHLLLSYPD